jgi:hypothetical protein
MVRLVHNLGALLWLVNAVMWFTHAHVAFMGFASLGGMVLSIWLAKNTGTWRYQ